MASELVDLIVTPLREYGRKLYKETGRRVKLEVTIEAELFDRLMIEIDRPYDLLQPSVVFFENAVQIVVTPKPTPLANRLAQREMDLCTICGKLLRGGHERDGSALCWGHDDTAERTDG